MPLKSITSILKSSKISGHLLLRDSSDPLVSSAVPKLRSGKWKVEEAVTAAEAELNFKKVCGITQVNKAGFGINKAVKIAQKGTNSYRRQVSATSKGIDEEGHLSKALSLQVQGSWTAWVNYVKNDLSWKTILATPPNLLSFCLAATFDVLPSPSNLHRWHINTEASCLLCRKNICTTAHILGACKASRDQGRFTYRHNLVLADLCSILSSFIQNIPSHSVNASSKIVFVKEGSKKAPHKARHSGLLFRAPDWILKADLSDDLVFPVFIAHTSQRPDMVIYSKSTKRVIIIELTCPCEENMEDWHREKTNRYFALTNKSKENGWIVSFFAIEVGARGYCSQSTVFCLRQLGFSSKAALKIGKSLGVTSMKASFVIWLSRNSKTWENPSSVSPSITPSVSPSTPENTHAFTPHKPSKMKAKKTTNSKAQAISHVGFINKGNSCYANAILQALSTVPALWSQWASESESISPLLRSISLNMSLLNRSKSPIDPSNFLRALQVEISKSRLPSFEFNKQQDAPEVLDFILDELKGMSALADNLFSVRLKTESSCDTCGCSSVSEDKLNSLEVPAMSSISKAIEKRFQPSLRCCYPNLSPSLLAVTVQFVGSTLNLPKSPP